MATASHRIIETNFCFTRVFLLALTKYSVWRGAGNWAIILWGLRTLLAFPNFFVVWLFVRLLSRSGTHLPCL